MNYPFAPPTATVSILISIHPTHLIVLLWQDRTVIRSSWVSTFWLFKWRRSRSPSSFVFCISLVISFSDNSFLSFVNAYCKMWTMNKLQFASCKTDRFLAAVWSAGWHSVKTVRFVWRARHSCCFSSQLLFHVQLYLKLNRIANISDWIVIIWVSVLSFCCWSSCEWCLIDSIDCSSFEIESFADSSSYLVFQNWTLLSNF